MQNKKYLIFIDIDGTLVECGGTKVSQDIITAIKKYEEKGHILVIATGRALAHTQVIEGIENFSYLACLYGSLIYDCKSKDFVAAPKALDQKETLGLVKLFEQKDIKWLFKDKFTDLATPANHDMVSRVPSQTLYKKVSDEKFACNLEKRNVYQIISQLGLDNSEIAKFKSLAFYKMPGDYFDIVDKTTSKKNCIDCLKMMFPEYTTVAIGDSLNDLIMFKNTDLSIAMGNANQEIQEAATYVTKDVKNNGLVYALENILKL